MEELWKAIVLGAVEGFTEFLPISSTGHLLVAERLLDFESGMGGTFAIFIQLGATLAMVLYFARDLIEQLRTVRHDPGVQRLWTNVILAFIPAGIIGFLIHDYIKEVLFVSPYVVPTTLILGGILMFVVEWYARRRRSQQADFQRLSRGQALAVGLAQVLALVLRVPLGRNDRGRDVCRGESGGGHPLFLLPGDPDDADRDELRPAEEPRYDLERRLDPAGGGDDYGGNYSLIAIAWLLRYVAHHSLALFGVYRIVVES